MYTECTATITAILALKARSGGHPSFPKDAFPGAAPSRLSVRRLTPPQLTLRRPHSTAPEPPHSYIVSSTPLFSSFYKIFRTNDVNSLNTSNIIILDNFYNTC